MVDGIDENVYVYWDGYHSRVPETNSEFKRTRVDTMILLHSFEIYIL